MQGSSLPFQVQYIMHWWQGRRAGIPVKTDEPPKAPTPRVSLRRHKTCQWNNDLMLPPRAGAVTLPFSCVACELLVQGLA